MDSSPSSTWIAFAAERRIAYGKPGEVATELKRHVDVDATSSVLVFDARTSTPVEIDLRGTLAAVLRRLPAEAPTTPEPPPAERTAGRPKLGVVAREVTLLPRHWEWLATQPGGASVVLRKLVDQALRANRDHDRRREAQEAAYRFMHVMAGDAAGFEEASRALFAGDLDRLRQWVAPWPPDVRQHLLHLAEPAVAPAEPPLSP